MMRNAYFAVFSAYSASWPLRVMGMVTVLLLMLSPIGMDVNAIGGWPVIPVLIASCFCLFTFAGLTKEQFTTPAARLVPEFFKHHLAVAGALTAVFWLVVAGVLAGVTAASFLGTASVLLTIFAMIAWGVCLQPAVLMLLFMLVFLPQMSSSGVAVATALFRGDAPAASAVLLVISAGALVVLGGKLACLTEEQPSYRRWFSRNGPTLGARSQVTEQQKDAISRSRFVRRQGERLEALLATPVAGLWRESRRLRIAAGYPSPAVFVIAVLTGSWTVLLAMVLIVEGLHVPKQPPSPHIAFVAVIVTPGLWRLWGKRLAQETIMPVDRHRLLRQIGLLMGTDLLKAWAAGVVMTLLAWAIISPTLLTDPQIWQSIVVALSGIPLFLAVGAFMMLIRSDVAFWALGMFLFMVGFVGGIEGLRYTDPLSVWLALSTGLVVAGAAACYGAYRAWLVADLA